MVLAENYRTDSNYAENRIFERFYSLTKPDTGKKSSGIGLNFVHEIVTLHRGSVHVANKPDGRGVMAQIVLPQQSSTNS